MLHTRADAYLLLEKLGAPRRLILHLQLVGEAAKVTIRFYEKLRLRFNAKRIALGVAVRDYSETMDAR